MRSLFAIVFAVFTASAAAQVSPPPDLQPVPEPPPPPPGVADTPFEPQVTIRKQGEDVIQEYRLNGKLYMVKVTPPHGTPYFLIDERGDGLMSRQESLDSGLRVPLWVIQSF